MFSGVKVELVSEVREETLAGLFSQLTELGHWIMGWFDGDHKKTNKMKPQSIVMKKCQNFMIICNIYLNKISALKARNIWGLWKITCLQRQILKYILHILYIIGLNDMDKISYLNIHVRYLHIDTIWLQTMWKQSIFTNITRPKRVQFNLWELISRHEHKITNQCCSILFISRCV